MQELGRPAERISITDTLPAVGTQLAEGEDVLRQTQPANAVPASQPGSAPPVPAPAAPLKRNFGRDLAGLLGRGKSIPDATADLIAKHPDSRAEILSAAAEAVTGRADT
jgi:hypothetical protein